MGGGEGQWAGDFDPFADPEERKVLFAAIDSFYQYRKAAHFNVTHRRRQSFYALPSTHWQRLAEPPFSYLDTLNLVDDAIDANADIARAIFLQSLSSFGLSEHPPSLEDGQKHRLDWRDTATPQDVDKARTTIRQLYRDWSAAGESERRVCYDPIVAALMNHFSDAPDIGQIKVLVPGAGLGRLVFDLVRAGFNAEGNEISYHQLLASDFILNHTHSADQLPLYPFALTFSNHHTRADQLQRVMIPDVHPATALVEASAGHRTHAFERMGMATGDFVLVYGDKTYESCYDVVATVFFVDTAPNLLRYMETVRHCLKPGGLWINLGPLLWHFEGSKGTSVESRETRNSSRDSKDGEVQENKAQSLGLGIAEGGSVELTNSEILALVESSGFTITNRNDHAGKTGYIQDHTSMLQNIYHAVSWLARKDEKQP